MHSTIDIMTCHVAMLLHYSLHVASIAAAFSYSFIVFSQIKTTPDLISRRKIFKNFLGGMSLDP